MARIWRTGREQRQRTEETLAREQEALISDYRSTFGSEGGQRVLADMLRRTGVMQSSWNGDGAEATAYREGRRRIGLELIEMINADPSAAAQMVQSGNTEDLYGDE